MCYLNIITLQTIKTEIMIRSIITLVACICLIVACTPTSSSVLAEEKPAEVDVTNTYGGTPQQILANALQRQSGVTVNDRGGQYTVLIRNGLSSFNTETAYFVVNGQRIGRDFGSAAQAIYGLDIKNIKVLKDSEASFYGSSGSGGVIEITAK